MDSPFLSKVDQVLKALEMGLDHPALALALTLPDVCARVTYGKTGGTYYVRWFETYVRSDRSVIDLETRMFRALGVEHGDRIRMYMRAWDYYNLRCAYLHSGKGGLTDRDGRMFYREFVLTTGDEDCSYSSMDNGAGGTCVKANIGEICRLICAGARRFYEETPDRKALDDCNIVVC